MRNNAVHLACIWTTALAVLVQGLGAAAGGVLCVGCTTREAGLALTSRPCAPADDCCAKQRERENPQGEEREGDDDRSCGCFDLVVSPCVAPLGQPPVRIIRPSWHPEPPVALTAGATDAPAVLRPAYARAGPVLVRVLVPAARRTVLLI